MTYPARLPLTGLPVAETGRRSALLAAWATAHLAGRVDAAAAVAAVTGTDEPHRVDGLSRGEDLPALLADLRASGAAGLRLVLPVPGDPRGLPGGGPLSDLALGAGEAVRMQPAGEAVGVQAAGPAAQEPAGGTAAAGKAGCYGLVPLVSRAGTELDGFATVVRWQLHPCPAAAGRQPAGSARQAARDLAEALRGAAGALAGLDVARLGPEAARGLATLREGGRRGRPAVRLPAGHPAEAQLLLAQADRLAAVLDLAGADDGAAVDRGSALRRQEVLRELAAAVRLARVAAVNAPLDG